MEETQTIAQDSFSNIENAFNQLKDVETLINDSSITAYVGEFPLSEFAAQHRKVTNLLAIIQYSALSEIAAESRDAPYSSEELKNIFESMSTDYRAYIEDAKETAKQMFEAEVENASLSIVLSAISAAASLGSLKGEPLVTSLKDGTTLEDFELEFSKDTTKKEVTLESSTSELPEDCKDALHTTLCVMAQAASFHGGATSNYPAFDNEVNLLQDELAELFDLATTTDELSEVAHNNLRDALDTTNSYADHDVLALQQDLNEWSFMVGIASSLVKSLSDTLTSIVQKMP